MHIVDVPVSPLTLVDFDVNQRATFSVKITLRNTANTAINLSDFTFAGACKPEYTAPDNTRLNFNINVTDAPNGELVIYLTPEQTSQMNHRLYYYDLVALHVPTGIRTRILEGRLNVRFGIA